jgi:hypothetical protein
MARTAPLPRRVLAIMLLISLPSASCYSTHHQRLEPNASLDSVTGITTRAGEEIPFAQPGATVANDTLFATGTVGPLKVPIDSIATVTSHGFSSGGSVVVIGAAALVVLGVLFIDLANSHGGT